MPGKTYAFDVPEGPLQDALQAEICNYALAEKLPKPKSGIVIRKLLVKALNLEPNQAKAPDQPPKDEGTPAEPEEYEIEIMPNSGYGRIVRTRKEPL